MNYRDKIVETLRLNLGLIEYAISLSVKNSDVELFNMLNRFYGSDILVSAITKLKYDYGYLEFKDSTTFVSGIVVFNSLKVTDKFKETFFKEEIERDYFKELKESYPRVTPNGRRLHVSTPSLRRKYLKLINNDPNEHELVLRCVKAEIEDLTKSGSLNFMRMLSTYVNNAYWNIYLDDVKDKIEKENRGEKSEEEPRRFNIL